MNVSTALGKSSKVIYSFSNGKIAIRNVEKQSIIPYLEKVIFRQNNDVNK